MAKKIWRPWVPSDSLNGWRLDARSSRVLEHQDLGVVYFLSVCDPDHGAPAQVHPLRVERGGAITVPIDSAGRIGLIEEWRPQLQIAGSNLLDGNSWQHVGRRSLEVPGGFSDPGDEPSETAVKEANEEGRLAFERLERLGEVVDNRSFTVSLVTVFAGWGASAPPGAPVRFVDWGEIAAMQQRGDIYCGLTLAALGILLLRYPQRYGGS